MQKVTLWVESILMVVLLSIVLWQRYQRILKAWWKTGERSRNGAGLCSLGHQMAVKTADWLRQKRGQEGARRVAGGEGKEPAGTTQNT